MYLKINYCIFFLILYKFLFAFIFKWYFFLTCFNLLFLLVHLFKQCIPVACGWFNYEYVSVVRLTKLNVISKANYSISCSHTT